MSDKSILDAVDEFPDLVNVIGGEVLDEFTGEQDNQTVKVFQCDYADNMFIIYAIEGNSHVTVEFQYRVLNDFIVARVDPDDDTQTVITIDKEEQSDLIEDADADMEDFLIGLEKDTTQRFYIDVLQKLRNSSVGYELYELDDDERITGFEVTTNLFPLDQEISPKEFYDAVQSVLSIGIPTRAYIQYSYGLRQYGGGQPVVGGVGNISFV